MDFINRNDVVALNSDFQTSYQLLWNENSKSERLTITKVQVFPGKTNSRHIHKSSEQIWIVLKGKGTLLLENDQTKEISEGDVVRFEDGETHGILNNSNDEFIYISVTSPPINFRYACDRKMSK